MLRSFASRPCHLLHLCSTPEFFTWIPSKLTSVMWYAFP
jgi:hypothetical protein